jgi:hypothetical protein
MVRIPFISQTKKDNTGGNIHIIEFGQKTPLNNKKKQEALRTLAKSDAKLRRMGLR